MEEKERDFTPTEHIAQKIIELEQQGDNIEQVNKPRRNKRRILLLLLLLIVTGFLLTTTTYAWFTSNRTVTVSDINVNVSTSGGIQISADGTNWKSVVSVADLNGVGGQNGTYPAALNQIPSSSSSLEPVSSALEKLTAGTEALPGGEEGETLSPGLLPMWHGIVKSNATGDYILTTSDITQTANGASGHFVSFDLFFRVDAESAAETTGTQKQIYLTTSSDVIATTDTGIKNAARVAFVKEGAVATGSALSDIQALNATAISTTAGSENVFLWEPNYNSHTSNGVQNAINVYGMQSSAFSSAAETLNQSARLNYSGVKAAITEAENITLANVGTTAAKAQAVTPTLTTEEGWGAVTPAPNYKQIFKLGVNQISKVKVYFWVEGQDVDCENNASGGAITLKLQFSLNSAAE